MTLCVAAMLLWLLGGVGIFCAFFLRVRGRPIGRRVRLGLLAVSFVALVVGMTSVIVLVTHPEYSETLF